MKKMKRIALVAHHNRKKDRIEWVEWNWNALLDHTLICTGTTGALVETALQERRQSDEAEGGDHEAEVGPVGRGSAIGLHDRRRRN
jgi:methylglyoxal synthase